ncbi:DUF1810 domain-containing protein [Sneathiella sp.]|uniref:DUF1810 domain-containing protein n=1 Tax=Sneathiella sp. TaxID=1964365 RepID=UPI002FE14A4F
MSEDEFQRFVTAQNGVLDEVEAELADGFKISHWMWFVFPQLAGLGTSAMAQRYAIMDAAEAARYLAHPILGERLRHAVRLMMRHEDLSALDILGSPDDLKFRSSVTLFLSVATDAADIALFRSALDRFYEGAADPKTLELLKRS